MDTNTIYLIMLLNDLQDIIDSDYVADIAINDMQYNIDQAKKIVYEIDSAYFNSSLSK